MHLFLCVNLLDVNFLDVIFLCVSGYSEEGGRAIPDWGVRWLLTWLPVTNRELSALSLPSTRRRQPSAMILSRASAL